MTSVFLWLFCNLTQGNDIVNINAAAVPGGYGGSNGRGWLFHEWCIFQRRGESPVFWQMSVCRLRWGNEASLQQSFTLVTCYEIRHNSQISKWKIIQKGLNSSTSVSHFWLNNTYFNHTLNIRKWPLVHLAEPTALNIKYTGGRVLLV